MMGRSIAPLNMMVTLFLFAFILILPQPGAAIPAFSSQTGAACRVCHFQGMHALSRYGSEFLRNGFRESDRMKQKRREKQRKKEQQRQAAKQVDQHK